MFISGLSPNLFCDPSVQKERLRSAREAMPRPEVPHFLGCALAAVVAASFPPRAHAAAGKRERHVLDAKVSGGLHMPE